jgi:hypothetical protein
MVVEILRGVPTMWQLRRETRPPNLEPDAKLWCKCSFREDHYGYHWTLFKNQKGNSYLLIAMDYFVRWLEVYTILTRKHRLQWACLWPSSSATWGPQGNTAATKAWTSIHCSCRCYGASGSARCKITLCIYCQRVWRKWVDERLKKVVLMQQKNWEERLPCRPSVSPQGNWNNACQYGICEGVSCNLLLTRSNSQPTMWETSNGCVISTSQCLKWPATGWRLIINV